jgi:hypothetical protein
MSHERPTSAFIGPCIGPFSFAQRGSWWSVRHARPVATLVAVRTTAEGPLRQQTIETAIIERLSAAA